MSDFIHELKNDHRVIQQVVAGMSAGAELLDSGKQVDPSALADGGPIQEHRNTVASSPV